MTDLPITASPLSLLARLGHRLTMRRGERSPRQDVTAALSELNTAQLHDIGLTWDSVLEARRGPSEEDAAQTLSRVRHRR